MTPEEKALQKAADIIQQQAFIIEAAGYSSFSQKAQTLVKDMNDELHTPIVFIPASVTVSRKVGA